MIIIFCTGLIIGTVAGMLSWLVAAAYLETQKSGRAMVANLTVQPELDQVGSVAVLEPVQGRTGRLFRPRGRRAATAVARETTRETARPSASL